MHKHTLVDSFDIDMWTPKLDYVACMEGKLIVKPFKKLAIYAKDVEQLTHIDLWGKYDQTFIYG
jgi:hypothetical protein